MKINKPFRIIPTNKADKMQILTSTNKSNMKESNQSTNTKLNKLQRIICQSTNTVQPNKLQRVTPMHKYKTKQIVLSYTNPVYPQKKSGVAPSHCESSPHGVHCPVKNC
jgi:hypothetical protein